MSYHPTYGELHVKPEDFAPLVPEKPPSPRIIQWSRVVSRCTTTKDSVEYEVVVQGRNIPGRDAVWGEDDFDMELFVWSHEVKITPKQPAGSRMFQLASQEQDTVSGLFAAKIRGEE